MGDNIHPNDGKSGKNIFPSGSDNQVSTNNAGEEDLSQQGMKLIMDIIKISNGLPLGQQRGFLSTFPEFVSSMAKEGDFILSVLSNAIRNEGIAGNIIRRDIEEKHDMIVDTNDIILERVDINLDEIQGIKRNPDPVLSKIAAAKVTQNKNSPNVQINGPNTATPPWKDQTKDRAMVRLINTRITHRPQIKFKDKIDNRNIPFEPRITEKPNSLKPLAILVEMDEENGESFSHPYEYELDLFKPTEEQLSHKEPIRYKALNEVPFLVVNDNKSLEEMMNHLKSQKEIAVDVEHHSYRTFQGITCLLQISSRERDFVIDALELRDRLHVLNEVFTDPKIVKKYWKVLLNEESHMDLYRKSRKLYDNRQMYALQRLYMWRDKIARDEDESYAYVLPNHMLLQISESLPREMQGILACCNPVPPLVRQNLLMIHKILLEAREQSLVKKHIETEAQRQAIEQAPNWKPVNVESKLYCPHDLSCSDELPENLPTVMQGGLKIEPVNGLSAKCGINVFANEEETEKSTESRTNDSSSIEVEDRTNAAKVQNQTVSENLSEKDIEAFEASRRQEAKRKRDESPPNSNSNLAEVQTPVEYNKKKKKKFDTDLPSSNQQETLKRSKQVSTTTVVEQPKDDDSVIPNLLGDQTEDGTDEKTKNKSGSDKRKSEENKDQEKGKAEPKKAKRDETFQPYNYEAFDFTKFQTQEKH
ncbi:hypothetical protein LSTR_LSTR004749 [Laodelphax striatellus]|uniref:HRDC domain-containing protein n=1 Tax=Laodelphax striatellus TaxID=195883 RepID=A0A482XJG2_LAOST|nr:hypothetical protein LSTR_LSTR004749 [Laodelphax striatellus]